MGGRGFILYHFSLPNRKHKDTQQFILTQCFHIFLMFSIGGAKMTKDRAKFSIGPDINMEVLLQCVRYLIFASPCGLYLSFKLGIFTLLSSVQGENPEVHSTSLVRFDQNCRGWQVTRHTVAEVCVCWGLLRVVGPQGDGSVAHFVFIPNWTGQTPAGNQETQQNSVSWPLYTPVLGPEVLWKKDRPRIAFSHSALAIPRV